MKINNLSVKLGNKLFFDNLSFELERGALHSLSGKNGSGKSTLFAALRGEIPCTGILTMGPDSYDLSGIDVKETVVLISQKFDEMIADQFSFKENLQLAQFPYRPSFFHGLSREVYLPPFMERFGIDYDQPVKCLSGGQRQILAVLMALQKKPSLLLLDEPTATLDPVNARVVFQFITSLMQEYPCTVIAICHDHDLIQDFRTGASLTLQVEENGLRRLLFQDQSCKIVF